MFSFRVWLRQKPMLIYWRCRSLFAELLVFSRCYWWERVAQERPAWDQSSSPTTLPETLADWEPQVRWFNTNRLFFLQLFFCTWWLLFLFKLMFGNVVSWRLNQLPRSVGRSSVYRPAIRLNITNKIFMYYVSIKFVRLIADISVILCQAVVGKLVDYFFFFLKNNNN